MSWFWLCAVLALLWLLGVLLSRHIQGLVVLITGRPRVATVVYDLLVLPGVVLHELSHVVAALALGLRVMRINLFQFRRAGDARQGEIMVARADPLRMSLVGAAPLLSGIVLLLLLVRWIDPPPVGFDLQALRQLPPLLRDPRSALGLYLLVAVANTMFPSEADRQAWWVVGVALLVLLGGLVLFGVRPELPPTWASALTRQADLLIAALLPVALIDGVLLAAVVLLELVVGRIRGRRVVYRAPRF